MQIAYPRSTELGWQLADRAGRLLSPETFATENSAVDAARLWNQRQHEQDGREAEPTVNVELEDDLSFHPSVEATFRTLKRHLGSYVLIAVDGRCHYDAASDADLFALLSNVLGYGQQVLSQRAGRTEEKP